MYDILYKQNVDACITQSIEIKVSKFFHVSKKAVAVFSKLISADKFSVLAQEVNQLSFTQNCQVTRARWRTICLKPRRLADRA
jgi:hypothetical protein